MVINRPMIRPTMMPRDPFRFWDARILTAPGAACITLSRALWCAGDEEEYGVCSAGNEGAVGDGFWRGPSRSESSRLIRHGMSWALIEPHG